MLAVVSVGIRGTVLISVDGVRISGIGIIPIDDAEATSPVGSAVGIMSACGSDAKCAL